MKSCTRCGETKSLEAFSVKERGKPYLKSHCKKCCSEKSASWAKLNPEKVKVKSLEWAKLNPEKKKKANAMWRSKNTRTEKQKEQTNSWSKNNPDARRIHRQNRRARKLNNGGTLSKGLAEKLFKLQRGKCICCGFALGDQNVDSNMQLLRSVCNMQKSVKHPVDFMQHRGFLI
jgi:hypothetical protein